MAKLLLLSLLVPACSLGTLEEEDDGPIIVITTEGSSGGGSSSSSSSSSATGTGGGSTDSKKCDIVDACEHYCIDRGSECNTYDPDCFDLCWRDTRGTGWCPSEFAAWIECRANEVACDESNEDDVCEEELDALAQCSFEQE